MQMCRSIKPLYNFDPPATDEEIEAAVTQFVRKISGFQKPSKVNEAAFQKSIKEITNSSKSLLGNLTTNSTPKNREIEAQKTKQRFESRQ